jgi:hypothetical protein
MDYILCKCLHYGYCIFPSGSVFDLLVLPKNRWWTQADKKHSTCEDVIQWILVWTINFTFMHLIYNARQKYGIWSLLVHEISILQIWNIVYIKILLLWKWAIHKALFSISACIPNIKEEKRKNVNVRKMFTNFLN